MNIHLVFFQHFHLCACSGVRVEHLHLLVELPLCTVKFSLLFLKLHNFRLQLLHIGVLHCALKLPLLTRKMHVHKQSGAIHIFINDPALMFSKSKWRHLLTDVRRTHLVSQFILQLLQSTGRTLQSLQLCSEIPQFLLLLSLEVSLQLHCSFQASLFVPHFINRLLLLLVFFVQVCLFGQNNKGKKEKSPLV